jgi:acetyltransferase-like isoleucine patch superfamily enzyme
MKIKNLNLKKILNRCVILNKEEKKKFSGIKFTGSCSPIFSIGEGSYANGINIYCWDSRVEVNIGKYCSLADNISLIAGGEHDKNWISTYPFIEIWKLKQLEYKKKPRYKGNIEIGHDVWIGNNVVILSGVNIGHGSVIGAGSIVTKDIDCYTIAAGNPAKEIKKRFDEEVIRDLLDIQWWHWTTERLIRGFTYIDDVKMFIDLAKKGEI